MGGQVAGRWLKEWRGGPEIGRLAGGNPRGVDVSDGVGAGTEPGGSNSGFGTGALVATGLIALVIGAGGGYAIGHSKGSDSGKEDGIAQGKAEEAAKYEAGQPAY